MVTKRKLLEMLGSMGMALSRQEREIESLKARIGALEKERESKADMAEARRKTAEGQKKAMMGFGDFRASHPFRPDQGRKES